MWKIRFELWWIFPRVLHYQTYLEFWRQEVSWKDIRKSVKFGIKKSSWHQPTSWPKASKVFIKVQSRRSGVSVVVHNFITSSWFSFQHFAGFETWERRFGGRFFADSRFRFQSFELIFKSFEEIAIVLPEISSHLVEIFPYVGKKWIVPEKITAGKRNCAMIGGHFWWNFLALF